MTANEPLTIGETLRQISQSEGISKLDAEVLLAHVLGKSRAYLYAWSDHSLTAPQAIEFHSLIQRCLQGEPIAYITGSREFWSLTLTVTPDTLIPRPETETLVERALDLLAPLNSATIADLGTGSGAIAAAIASERPQDKVIATDFSAAALSVAKTNFDTLGLIHIELFQGEWCSALPKHVRCDLIISNPPYIADGDPHLQQNGLPWEPLSALTSGSDGLQDIRLLTQTSHAHLNPDGWLIVEHGVDQGNAVRELFSQARYRDISTHKDLEDRDRLTAGRRPLDDALK